MDPDKQARFAIYFMPRPTSPLWPFGCAAIGYDAITGSATPLLPYPAIANAAAINKAESPARYGFHATLKAPFALAAGKTEPALMSAAEQFACNRQSFTLPSLAVSRIGAFVALTPCEEVGELRRLAEDCVREFEPFRAPLLAHDRARRLSSRLTERQLRFLDMWGYPYVFEEFRFHMTLTGSLPDEQLGAAEAALRSAYEAYDGPVEVNGIAVFKQVVRAEPFRVLRRFEFAGPASP